MRESRICIYCRVADERLLKIGVRHYAHTRCFVAARGEQALLDLSTGVLGAVAIFEVSEETREQIMARLMPRTGEGAREPLPGERASVVGRCAVRQRLPHGSRRAAQ